MAAAAAEQLLGAVRARLSICLDNAFAPATTAAYKAKIRAFDAFAASVEIDTTREISGDTVALFVAHATAPIPEGLNWGGGSVQTALTALRKHCSANNIVNNFDNAAAKTHVATALRGALRVRPQGANVKRTRHPVTSAHLAELLAHGARMLAPLTFLCWRAVALTALVTAARLGELTARTQSANAGGHAPASSDMMRHEARGTRGASYTIRLATCKTDQVGNGTTLVVTTAGGPDADNNAFMALDLYTEALRAAGVTTFRHPFVMDDKCTPLTQSLFTKILRKLLEANGDEPKNYGSHSFRRAAASSLAQANVSASDISSLGRWRSAASRDRYIQAPTDRVHGRQTTILSSTISVSQTHGPA
jgi:hypothetical protein